MYRASVGALGRAIRAPSQAALPAALRVRTPSVVLVGAAGARTAHSLGSPLAAARYPLLQASLPSMAPAVGSATDGARRWLAADAKAAPAKPDGGGGGGGGGKKKKKDKGIKPMKQPMSGHKFGHGAEDRPPAGLTRAVARKERLAMLKGRVPTVRGDDIVTDDEDMQQLYDLVNKNLLDRSAPVSDAPLPEPGQQEDIHLKKDDFSTRYWGKYIPIPDDLRPNVKVVDDDFDLYAGTDIETDEGEGAEERPDFPKRAGQRPRNELERAPASGVAAALRHGAHHRDMILPTGGARVDMSFEGSDVGTDGERGAGGATDGDGSERGELTGADELDLDVSEDEILAARGGWRGRQAAAERKQPRGALDPEDLADEGLVEDSEGELQPAPPLATTRPSMLRHPGLYVRGAGSEAEENDALLDEQARSLFEQASKAAAAGKKDAAAAAAAAAASRPSAGASSSIILDGDDSSDWGGDPMDYRFEHEARAQQRDYERLYGLKPIDTDAEKLLAVGIDDEEGARMAPMFGDRVEAIPESVIHELATPFDFQSHSEGELYPKARTVREADMTPEERLVDEQRKALRELIERPLPVVNRPMWPTYAMLAAVDQVTQVVSGGMIQSTRCMIVVGNGMGGAGFGIGKHKEAFMATKQALAHAQRDMIHVSTHKGQLYHDLIGKRNNVYVIIRTMPAVGNFLHGAPIIQDVFEMMGVKHASAKIVGSRRRNPYIVMHALFDAFNHHIPPEDEAVTRGLRMQWMGADRHNPRNAYPFQPTGPRYPSANQRLVRGTWR